MRHPKNQKARGDRRPTEKQIEDKGFVTAEERDAGEKWLESHPQEKDTDT